MSSTTKYTLLLKQLAKKLFKCYIILIGLLFGYIFLNYMIFLKPKTKSLNLII